MKMEKQMAKDNYSGILAINEECHGFLMQLVSPEPWMKEARDKNLDCLIEDPFIGIIPGLYFANMKDLRKPDVVLRENQTPVTWTIEKPIIKIMFPEKEKAEAIIDSMKH